MGANCIDYLRCSLEDTGDTLSPQARQLLDESACASLDKPFAKADLLAAVHAALDR